MSHWLGIDFGTSNSAAAYWHEERVVSVELEAGRETIPTAIFFDFSDKKMLIGSPASHAFISGYEGRYMRSLKSVLGTALMAEKRQLLFRRLDFYDIIAEFIKLIKHRAEKQSGLTFDNVVAGRPVFFHHTDAARNEKAKEDLEKCFLKAGFSKVEFVFEPEAAAQSAGRGMDDQAVGLVVDIGGGTSDFTIFKRVNDANEINASNGLRLGGTDIDKQISFDHIMPLMGRGQRVRRRMATGELIAPVLVYNELATWQKIPFLYNQKTTLLVKELMADAVEPKLFARMLSVLENRLGHDLAFLAEATKIEINRDRCDINVDLGFIESNLSTTLSTEQLEESTQNFGDQISQTIGETLEIANVSATDVQFVLPVGGSSIMQTVQDAIERKLPHAKIHEGAIFTSIVEGLAMRAGEHVEAV